MIVIHLKAVSHDATIYAVCTIRDCAKEITLNVYNGFHGFNSHK